MLKPFGIVCMKKEKGTDDTSPQWQKSTISAEFLTSLQKLFKGREGKATNLFFPSIYISISLTITTSQKHLQRLVLALHTCQSAQYKNYITEPPICILTPKKNTYATKGMTQNSPHLGNGKGLQAQIVSPFYRR